MATQVNHEKTAAALSYILVGIIWYFVDEHMKRSTFVKFHVKQALVLIGAGILWNVALSIIFTIVLAPFLFGGLFGIWFLFRLLYYIPAIFAVLGIINALNNRTRELPIIGGFAAKLTF